MFNRSFIFENAWWLWLLMLLPVIWWLSRRSLAGLGRWRRMFAIGFRSLVLALLVCALAGMQSQRTTDRVTVIYLLDQSLSIPEEQFRAMVDYVNASIKGQRQEATEDRAGVIVFGRDAAVELPPIDAHIPVLHRTESLLDLEYTDVAGAMRRASALFAGDTAKRIVVISDGNENLGDALRQARAVTEAGVSIDVVAVPLATRDEISVEKVTIPADVRKDQPFDLRVVLNRDTSDDNGSPVTGKLRIVRSTGEREQTIVEQEVSLPPGKSVLSIPEEIGQSDFYTYRADFIPDDPADDGTPRNNEATTFTHVRGKGQVLLIEDHANRGEFDYLVGRLRAEGIEVRVRPSNQAFASLPELQRYDSVILANVPRASGGATDEIAAFSDEQIEMLTSNTRLGCGLIVLGGPNSYGAGGWTGTKLEKALPVDFQIKNAKVAPVGALVLMMHAGEMPQANYWQKKVSIEAIKALGYQDWCGMVQWSGKEDWLWNRSKGGMSKVGPKRQMMLQRVDKMMVGDMPDFDAPMKMAAAAFKRLDRDPNAKPAVKHMIIISDGDANAPAGSTIKTLRQLKVTVTTVAVPSHGMADRQYQRRMKDIADATGGKFHVVRSGKALPRIYQTEVRRISRPLIKEFPAPGAPPQIVSTHEMLKGIGVDLPPITGFVMTTVKDSPLVEVVLATPAMKPQENATILAGWTYGLGKAAAFTTDAGKRWATAWTGWEGYDRFFSQMVRWSMRPLGDTGKFSIATEVGDGKTRVVVTAIDEDDAFLNYQMMTGMAIGPDLKMTELRIDQVAPGRYVGEFESQQAGSYSIAVIPGAGKGQILTGVNVGYSGEYRDRETNLPLLQAIVELPAKDGEPGKFIEAAEGDQELKEMLTIDPFRRDLPKAVAIQDIWPWLVMLGSCIFLADVFVRRVAVSFDWVPPLAARVRAAILGRSGPIQQEETMSRLKSRKAEVGAAIDQRRAATRFEADQEAAETAVDLDVLAEASRAAPAKPVRRSRQELGPDSDKESESYTERLLKAKKQVWKDRGEDA